MQKIQIKHTMRVLPHDQDTGGFYVALIRKKSLITWKAAVKEKIQVNSSLLSTQTEPASLMKEPAQTSP